MLFIYSNQVDHLMDVRSLFIHIRPTIWWMHAVYLFISGRPFDECTLFIHSYQADHLMNVRCLFIQIRSTIWWMYAVYLFISGWPFDECTLFIHSYQADHLMNVRCLFIHIRLTIWWYIHQMVSLIWINKQRTFIKWSAWYEWINSVHSSNGQPDMNK
jgi:hypothetical protein